MRPCGWLRSAGGLLPASVRYLVRHDAPGGCAFRRQVMYATAEKGSGSLEKLVRLRQAQPDSGLWNSKRSSWTANYSRQSLYSIMACDGQRIIEPFGPESIKVSEVEYSARSYLHCKRLLQLLKYRSVVNKKVTIR